MFFLQYLQGCGDLSSPALLPESDIPILDVMPLVEPNWFFADYYQDTSTHYKNELNLLNLVRSDPDVHLDGVDFTEYLFTVEATDPRDVYALTSGRLYFVQKGRKSPQLGNVTADEDMLILEPLPVSVDNWRKYHPEKSPVLERVVYRNITLDVASLKTQIAQYRSEDYLKVLFLQLKETEYIAPPGWVDAYWDLFLNFPEVALLVQGGIKLATTNLDPTGGTQLLKMLININGWSANEEFVKTFFRHHNRLPSLEGHPMLALLTEMPVEAGYIDYMEPLDLQKPALGRPKDFLAKLPEPFMDTPRYHAIALNPNLEESTLVVQKAPPPSLIIPEIPADHGITGLLIHKPLPLPIALENFNANDVVVNQTSLSVTEELFTFQATPTSPEELPLGISTIDPVTGASVDLIKIALKFLPFKKLPIQFHQLTDTFLDGTRLANINSSELSEVIKIANYILGRQTNVYISPLVDAQNLALSPLHFDDDLGMELNVNSSIVDSIFYRIWDAPSDVDCHVIFTWNLVRKGDPQKKDGPLRGYCRASPLLGSNPVILVSVPFTQFGQPKDLVDIGFVLVHELGHWITLNFIDEVCARGSEHFAHDDCSNGDTRLYLNVMAEGESANSGKLISAEQAKIYNMYSGGIQPQ